MPANTQPKSISGRKYHAISVLQFVLLFGPENGESPRSEIFCQIRGTSFFLKKKKNSETVSSLHYISTYFKELMRKILATNQIGLVLPMYYHSPYSDA